MNTEFNNFALTDFKRRQCKEDMILLLAKSQFELFQILHEAVSTEQYEAAQDIQQLINQVRQTIKTYSCR